VKWDASARSARATLVLRERVKKDGYKIFAVEQHRKSISYHKLPKSYILNSKFCLVFGNEVRGLSPAILKKSDKILEIPMRGAVVRQAHHPRRAGRGKESLNVSVAFGIVVFGLLYK
ncbi:MAG: TrmH family RNA methyltransferase, partial [Patescibacteria group bacterium]